MIAKNVSVSYKEGKTKYDVLYCHISKGLELCLFVYSNKPICHMTWLTFFEVNIRICQPKNSDVHRGEAEVNITFEG